ncbi:hypothetical protein CYLTODRAFT_489880 [Cylindrobasidium torrendii FP15055 ss-10]|uniref:F-box domain-containing protein n=1 Tax=Cylindrobasidium torrendii FP15055 ss-10 TaxID=1314674 RepID=A0A0D7BDN9_9AGAR|nr:hypothetical protein CYLTODRAFT_489880 [Cylindrobasidium torrendii FP15055 ss-10]
MPPKKTAAKKTAAAAKEEEEEKPAARPSRSTRAPPAAKADAAPAKKAPAKAAPKAAAAKPAAKTAAPKAAPKTKAVAEKEPVKPKAAPKAKAAPAKAPAKADRPIKPLPTRKTTAAKPPPKKNIQADQEDETDSEEEEEDSQSEEEEEPVPPPKGRGKAAAKPAPKKAAPKPLPKKGKHTPPPDSDSVEDEEEIAPPAKGKGRAKAPAKAAPPKKAAAPAKKPPAKGKAKQPLPADDDESESESEEEEPAPPPKGRGKAAAKPKPAAKSKPAAKKGKQLAPQVDEDDSEEESDEEEPAPPPKAKGKGKAPAKAPAKAAPAKSKGGKGKQPLKPVDNEESESEEESDGTEVPVARVDKGKGKAVQPEYDDDEEAELEAEQLAEYEEYTDEEDYDSQDEGTERSPSPIVPGPIHMLPPEILCEIFAFLLSPWVLPYDFARKRLKARRVCRLWNDTVINDNRLWTYVHIEPPLMQGRTLADVLARIELDLARAAPLPLDLHLTRSWDASPTRFDPALIQRISTLIPHARTIFMSYGDMASAVAHVPPECKSLPLLTKVHIELEAPKSAAWLKSIAAIAPNFHDFTGEYASAQPLEPDAVAAFKNLTRLRVGWTQIQHLQGLFDATPNLEWIDIPTCTNEKNLEVQIKHPSVVWLTLGYATCDWLPVASFPSLKHLSIGGAFGGRTKDNKYPFITTADLKKFVANSNCNLHGIKIRSSPLEKDFVDFLKDQDDLRYLKLCHPDQYHLQRPRSIVPDNVLDFLAEGKLEYLNEAQFTIRTCQFEKIKAILGERAKRLDLPRLLPLKLYVCLEVEEDEEMFRVACEQAQEEIDNWPWAEWGKHCSQVDVTFEIY